MRAVVQDEYGTTDVLRLEDVPEPSVGADDVLVRVRAAGVDPSVWHLMTGLPLVARLGLGLRAPRTPVRGRDLSGTVEKVGADVTEFRPGDDVFGTCGDGAFADYAVTRRNRLARKPSSLSFTQASVVPTSACTALKALREQGNVRAGHRVLVIGAGGGIGTFAVQLAKTFDANVTGVCGPAKTDLVRSLGADDVIDYTEEDFADRAERYDLIVDTAGNRPLRLLRRALAERGTLVLVGGEGGGRWLGGLERTLRAVVTSPFTRQNLRGLVSTESAKDLEYLADLMETGKVTPVVDHTFDLTEAAVAIDHLMDGRAAGKLALTIE